MSSLVIPVNPWDTTVFTLVLGAFGTVVHFLSTRRLRRLLARPVAGESLDWLDSVVERLRSGTTVPDVWSSMTAAASSSLAHLSVRLVPAGSSALPVIARHRGTPGGASAALVIPHGGAVARLSDPRARFEVEFMPSPGFGALQVPRAAVIAFVDDLEVVASVSDQVVV